MIQKIGSAIAVIFGLITLFASSRILYFGADAGYMVFQPLLIFNHIMGFCYLAAGYVIWNNKQKGQLAALVLFIINLAVLITISVIYLLISGVATDSLAAMTFRTIVWLLIFTGLKMTRKQL